MGLFSLLFFLFCSGIEAGISIMPKAGCNISFIADDPDAPSSISQKPNIGLIGGLGLELDSGILAVEADVFYSQAGEKYEYSISYLGTECQCTEKYKYDYLVFPVLLKMIIRESAGAFFLGAGASLGMLLSAEDEATISVSGVSATTALDIKEYQKSTDIGLVAAAGIELSHFILEGRYTYGLTDINNIPGGTVKSKNNIISVLAGYRFGL